MYEKDFTGFVKGFGLIKDTCAIGFLAFSLLHLAHKYLLWMHENFKNFIVFF